MSFYTDGPNAAYKLYAGRSLAALSYRGSGTVSQPGYVTVPLRARLGVAKGAVFVVAVRLDIPGDDTPIPLEAPLNGYAPAKAAAGQSFVQLGRKWTDLTTQPRYRNVNVCLKAFAQK